MAKSGIDKVNSQSEVWDREYALHAGKWKLETRTLPKILGGQRVLEIGVGNGKTLKAILRQKPKEIIAVDFSKEAIEYCKRIFKEDNASFVQTNLTRLPFSENSFDVVVCYYTLNNLLHEDRKQAVAEIFRVTKKGGQVAFEDFGVGDFRQENDSKVVEPNTIVKQSGIICHFFDKSELDELFCRFSKREFSQKSSTPIAHKPVLKRRMLSGIMEK